MILACYAGLDPKDPTAPVKSSYGTLLERLRFPLQASLDNPDQPHLHTASQYEAIWSSLFNLFTRQIRFKRSEYERDARGRAIRRIDWQFCGHVLETLGFGYLGGVDPNLRPAEEVVNVGTAQRQVLKIRHMKPIYLLYALNRELVHGLQQRGEHFTVVNQRFFDLRRFLNNHFVAVKLAFWLLGHRNPCPKIGEEKLMAELRLGGHDRGRAQAALAEACRLLTQAGAILGVHHRPYAGRSESHYWEFEKSPDYFYLKDDPIQQALGTSFGGNDTSFAGESHQLRGGADEKS